MNKDIVSFFYIDLGETPVVAQVHKSVYTLTYSSYPSPAIHLYYKNKHINTMGENVHIC